MGGITTPLGDTLRQLREQAGYSQRELATLLGWQTNAQLSRYESGGRRPSTEVLERILDALDVEDPERERLLALVRREGPGELVAGVPSTGRHLAQLIGLERAARRVTEVAPLVVPGLLQTRAYANVMLGEDPDTDRRVALRMERAEILTRAEHPVELRAFIHIEALTRPMASPEVMSEQRAHLLSRAKLPNVTIQVVPTDLHGWPSPSLAGPFILIESSDASPIVHIEHYRGGAFVWEPEDVRSYAAAVDKIAQRAMTPARTAKVIQELEQTQ
jgi:transcriptional regulator with XRE-family HTH domain